MDLVAEWLGRIDYHAAWARQHELVRARADGTVGDTLLLLEHPAVLTLGRQSDPAYVRASADELARRGIDLVRTERGGEVTYHGPGQLVAYPIVHLAQRGVLLRPFVRALEAAMARTAAHYGVVAGRRDGHPGCWVDRDGASPRKVGALGLRVERGVTYHGIALNITTRLTDFQLIDPCGMPDVEVTSIAREAGWQLPGDADTPTTESVEAAAAIFASAFREALDSAAGSGGSAPRRPALVGA